MVKYSFYGIGRFDVTRASGDSISVSIPCSEDAVECATYEDAEDYADRLAGIWDQDVDFCIA